MTYEHGSGEVRNPETRIEKDATVHLVSAARRRVLIGIATTVPVILTLRSKPAFGANICASLSMSAATSHGVVALPNCKLR